jgi:hypothetical protein
MPAPNADGPPPFYTPIGPSVREVVEATIVNINSAPGFKGIGGVAGKVSSWAENTVPAAYQRKKVRWPGTVVENTTKDSKLIMVRVANLQGNGQTFRVTYGVVPLKGKTAPAVGAEVWVEGLIVGGGSWLVATRYQDEVVIDVPVGMSSVKLLP